MAMVASGPTFVEGLESIRAMHQRGERAQATDAFLAGVLGLDYRTQLERFLPPGALELAVADSGTVFDVEVEALQRWTFTPEDAARIRSPALSVIGADSEPIFHEVHSLLKQRIAGVEEWTVPDASHALQFVNPGAVAEGLAAFFGAHRL